MAAQQGWLTDGARHCQVDALYAGYGECAEICAAQGAADPYCVRSEDTPSGWAGVNLTRWLAEGTERYLAPAFPALDRVLSTEVLSRGPTGRGSC